MWESVMKTNRSINESCGKKKDHKRKNKRQMPYMSSINSSKEMNHVEKAGCENDSVDHRQKM